MKKFDVRKLPKWAQERIDLIEWNCGDFDDDVAGLVWTKDEWLIDDSHCCPFSNKADLLSLLRDCEHLTPEQVKLFNKGLL